MSSSTSSTTMHPDVVPSEVGWQFVPQYYTFVNKQPNRLHCFYTKSSTFVHGTEGEESKACFGQHEIHEKITSIGFQDCKVFIHSVDAQASANSGIIIQVIGEMSNRGEPWRKFVQTFFLAEQPNGYFVLNDIFRFLKEDSVESDDADDAAEPEVAPAESEPTPAPEAPQAPAREPTPPAPVPVAATAATPSPAPSFPPPSEEPPTNDVPELVPQPPSPEPQPAPTVASVQPNGHTAVPEPEKPAPAPPVVTQKSPAPTPAPPPAPAPTTATAPPTPTTVPPAAAPPQPRSWASLAASDSKNWGPAVVRESRGTTESPAPSNSTQMPAPTTSASASRGPTNSLNNPSAVFIKGIYEPLTPNIVRDYLSSKFGVLQSFEPTADKPTASAVFCNSSDALSALRASPVEIELGDKKIVRVVIEQRREQRPRPRTRGGTPMNGGEGRGGQGGGYRGGRGGHSGMRRGAPPAK